MSKKSAKPKAVPWGPRIADTLQCVTDPEPNQRQNFWTVARTGVFGWDCLIGEMLATTLLDRLGGDDLHLTFGSVIRDMVAGGTYTGVEVGFISAIGQELARGRPGRSVGTDGP